MLIFYYIISLQITNYYVYQFFDVLLTVHLSIFIYMFPTHVLETYRGMK